jgi:deazaflavin-dependent oxidoreductase (nitroreductase family)
MSEYQLAFINVSDDQLRKIFKAFNRFMVLLFRLGLGSYGNGTKYGGYIMVIKHTGRKTGLTRLTPVNYAVVDEDIYCTSGFGKVADWYLNIEANPRVEVWLPDGRWAGIAEDVTGEEDSAHHLRQVIVASGLAGPLFGVNPKVLSDPDFEEMLQSYRLIRIRKVNALTGAGGPGDLFWIWPLTTFILLLLLLRRRRK